MADLSDLFGEDEDEQVPLPAPPSPKRQRLDPQQQPRDGSEEPEQPRTAEDDLFIDDAGVEAADYQSDGDMGHVSEAEEEQEDEISRIFTQKKRKRAEKSMGQIKQEVEGLLTRLEVAAEMDVKCVTNQTPAVHKLSMLGDIQNIIAEKSLHRFFLDAGLLDILRAWLELLPDSTLPNIKVRTAVLQLLTALQIDLIDETRKSQLQKSGLGKVVMFLSKLPDETPGNRRLAKAMVQAWFQQINAQHRDPRTSAQEVERSEREAHNRAVRLQAQRANAIASVNPSEDPDGLDERGRRALKPGDDGFRFHASIPQAARMDYLRKPEGKQVDLLVKGRGPKAKQGALTKHLAKLGRSGKVAKPGKVSVQGRDLAV